MNPIYIRIFLVVLTLSVFSCSPEDGINGMDGEDGIDGNPGNDGTDGQDGADGQDPGKGIVVITGAITDEEAATLVRENTGPNTHTLIIEQTTNLTTVDFPEITTLVEIEIDDNEKLQTISFPNLSAIFGDAIIEDNIALTTLDFPALENTFQRVNINSHEALETINMSNLKKSLGMFELRSNSSLKSIDLESLVEVDRFRIDRNDLLETLLFPALVEGNFLRLNGNKNATSIALPALQSITTLQIDRNDALTSIDVANLTTVRRLEIEVNPVLVTLDLSALSTVEFVQNGDRVNGNILIQENTLLTTILLTALTSAGEIEIINNENLSTINSNALTTAINIAVNNNPKITELSLPELTSVDDFEVNSNADLNSLNLSKLTTSGRIAIDNNEALTQLDFPALTTNTGDFKLLGNQSLSSAIFTNLEVSSGTFEVENNADLTSLSFPVLRDVGNLPADRFSIANNGTFALFDFSSLETVSGSSFLIENSNFEMDELSFPALKKVGKENTTTFEIKNNNVRAVDFPNLEEVVNGEIAIIGTFLGRYFFGNLTTFSSFNADNEAAIITVDFSSIQNFNSIRMRSNRGTTNIVDTVLTRLVAITPPIMGTTIELDGVASAEALTQIQTLRDNGNVITVEPF